MKIVIGTLERIKNSYWQLFFSYLNYFVHFVHQYLTTSPLNYLIHFGPGIDYQLINLSISFLVFYFVLHFYF